ncbi:hypothetical protein BH23ACT9_BH23ACT9_06960 [soil metagenome]
MLLATTTGHLFAVLLSAMVVASLQAVGLVLAAAACFAVAFGIHLLPRRARA